MVLVCANNPRLTVLRFINLFL